MIAVVLSDSHGDESGVRWMMEQLWQRWPRVDAYLHCGDGARDFARLTPFLRAHDPEAQCWNVRGNCDWVGDVPEEEVLSLGGAFIYMTHGHLLRVKQGLLLLDEAAEQAGCSIALYGHTHVQATDHRRTLMINPGAACDGRLAVLEIQEGRPRIHMEHFT